MECIGWNLSDDDSTQTPANGVTEVKQLISCWRSRDMGKELNDDQLFTAILTNGDAIGEVDSRYIYWYNRLYSFSE